MLATDGVFSTDCLPLGYGDGLGQWSLETHAGGIFIVQPGLYFVNGTVQTAKTRGVPYKAVKDRYHEFCQVWQTYVDSGGTTDATLPIDLHQFVGIRLATARGKPETAGEWFDTQKQIGFEWQTKRQPDLLVEDAHAWRTTPYEGGIITTPYRKRIGGNLIREYERLEFDDESDNDT